MHTFGKTSLKHIAQSHPDLQIIHQVAIKSIRVDYGIHDSARSIELQLKYFLEGSSQLDPRVPEQLKKSKHVVRPDMPLALANDIHVAESYQGKNLIWDSIHLTYVAAYLVATADLLFAMGKITHRLRWGGNWDMDGIIQLDHTFKDNPHLELIIP